MAGFLPGNEIFYMRRIGLTGGIASGKSTVCQMLRDRGCSIIDADKVAHEILQRGRPGFEPVVGAFGQTILNGAGEIDRSRLGAIVFNQPERLTQLTSIVHPHVTRAILRWLEGMEQAGPVAHAIVDGSVLVESGFHRDFQYLIVVYCTPEQQLERLMKRNSLSENEARKRMALQMPLEEKVRLADFVVDNSGSLENTRYQVDVLLDRLGWFPLGGTLPQA